MELDGFTIIAQVINFIVLVLLLKHFLYGPVVKAMKAREQTIREQLQGAEAKATEADRQAQHYAALQQELEDKRESLLEEARHEVHAQRAEQMEALRQEIAATRTRWHEEVEYEKNNFLSQARIGIGQQACDVARKVLQDLAGEELEAQLLAYFLKHLQGLDGEEAEQLQQLLQARSAPIQVVSSFELSDTQQQALMGTLQQINGAEVPLLFEVDGNLLCGIALQLDAHKVAWNMADYLGKLEHDLLALLNTPISNDIANGEPGGQA